MMNNYNSLSSGASAWLKNDVGAFHGSPPTNTNTPRRTSWLTSLFLLFFMFLSIQNINAQLTPTTWNFAANSTGWTGNFTRSTLTNASMCGTPGMRRNLYSSAPTGNLVTPVLPGTNNLGDVTVTYKYKTAGYSSPFAAVNPWGSFTVQVGNTATGPWTTVATVSQETQTGSCITKTHTFAAPSGALYIRWNFSWTAGDYWMSFDDISVSQAAPVACSGTPAPGNTVASATTVSPGGTTVLSLATATAGTGVTYQWQSGPSNTGPWTNVGTSAATYTATIAATTWYQCAVTCSGVTTTSNPREVIMGYCVPSTGSQASYTSNFTTTNGVNNIAHTATSGAAGGYSNLSSTVKVSNYIGNLTNLSLTAAGPTCGFAIWVDWNNNLLFETGEKMYGTTGYVTSTTGSITIPLGTAIGNYRMRVVVDYNNSAPTDPCATLTRGEYKDFTFEVVGPPTCVPPTALVLSSQTLSSATVSWTASTIIPGNGYEYIYSTTNTAPAVGATPTGSTAAGVTTATFSGLVTETNYFWWVRANCDGVDKSAWAAGATIRLGYCAPVTTYGCADGDVIARVVLNTLDNNSGTGCPSDPNPADSSSIANAQGPGYSNYTTNPALTTTLQAGSSYNCTVYAGQWGEGYAAWIDYNDDGVFNNVTEKIGFSIGQVAGSGFVGVLGSSASFPIAVACNPPLGTHRLRVRAMYNISGSAVTPCDNNSYGEIEDYVITISAADPCPQPSFLGANTVTPTSANLTWTLGCAETNWEVAVQAAGSGTPTSGVATTSTTYAASGLTPGSQYEFYVRAACTPGSLYSAWTGPFMFSAPACTTVVSPANGATNVAIVAGAVQITWAAAPGATSYDIYFGATSGVLTNLGNFPVTTIGITGLLFNQTSYWSIIPKNEFGSPLACSEWSFTTEGPPAFDTCAGATDLGTLTSPISNTTAGLANNFLPSCALSSGTAPDAYYSIVVPNGYSLSIGNTVSSFDNANSLFYGSCATQTPISCLDADTTAQTWTNTTGSTQTVYWVQDGWGSGSGTFTLAWTLTPPPVVVTSFAPTTVCGQAGGATVVITGSNFTGATDVQFNGISAGAGNYTVDSDTQITATLPAGNTSGAVTVYNVPSSNGSASSAGSFTVNAFPVVDPIVGATTVCAPNTIALTNNSALGVWSSSNDLVATVDAAGFVTGVAAGSVTISYTVTENACPTAVTHSVTVSNPVAISAQPTPQGAITGTNATFSIAASGTGITYQWLENGSPLVDDSTYGGSTTNTLTITAAPETLNGNAYSCVVTGTSPCAPETSIDAVLSVGNTGITTNPATVNLCNSGDAIFTVLGSGDVDDYTWFEDQGFGPEVVVDGGIYSGATTGTLTVSGVTTDNNGWSYYAVVNGPGNSPISTTASLNVAVGVAITTQPTSQSFCRISENATFTVAASGTVAGIQWQSSANGTTGWTNVGTGTSLNVSITGASPVGVTYYKAVVSGSASCAAEVSNIVTLTVIQPTIAVSPSAASYCVPGAAVSLTASGASTYAWSPATGLSATTGATVMASPSVTTTYTVTGTDGSGCVNSTTVTITTGPVASATVSATPTTFCTGLGSQLAVVTPVVSTTVPNYSFSAAEGTYTPLVGGTSSTASGDDGTQNTIAIGFPFSYGGANFTTFSISTNGTIKLGATATSYTNSLSSNTNVLAAMWDDNHLSAGSITYLTTGTTPNRVLTVQWADISIGGGGSSGESTNNFQIQLFEGTNVVKYNYGALSDANGPSASIGMCGAVAGQYISVTPSTPVASSTSSTSSEDGFISVADIPSGTVYTFTPPVVPVYTYAWSPATYLSSTTIANPVASNVTSNITYTVVVTNNFGCNVTLTQALTVESGAAIGTQPVAASQCAGTTATFTVVGSGPGLTYQWRKNGTPITGNATAATATLTLATIVEGDEASYDVVVIPACGDSVTSNAVALTVNDIPTAVATNNGPICAGTTLNLFGATSNGVTFAWTGPNGFTSTSQNPSIPNVTVAAAGVYTFTATSAATCSFSGTTTVSITASPALSVTTTGGATACIGEIKTLTAAATTTATGTATISFGTNLISTGGTAANFPATITGIPAGATVVSAQLQLTNVNAINGSWRSEFRAALTGGYALAATQISTTQSAGLISPDPTINLPGFTATSGAITLRLTESYDDPGVNDASVGAAQLVINYSYNVPTTVTWSPTTNLYTDANTTVAYTGGAASTVYARVDGAASYTATTAANALGCARTAVVAYTMTTAGCAATTNVQPSQWGTTLTNIDDYIYATAMSGAQGYRFRVTNLVNNQVQSIDRFLRVFRVTQLPNYAFNTEYRVEVALRKNDAWQPFYGVSCTVKTPAATTQLINCGASLTAMTDVIYANSVQYATGYRFRVTNVLNPLDTQVINRSLREFRMNNLSGITYNTTYTVEVAVRDTDGVTYLPYGQECTVTTPIFPASYLQDSQCDDYLVPSNATILYAESFNGAEGYRFRLQNSGLGYEQSVDRVLRTVRLSDFTGLTPGSTYTVKVALKINGVWGSFTGKACSIIPPGATRAIESEAVVVKGNFAAVAYPNPFASTFAIQVQTSSQEVVQLKVYDMIGRLVEQRESKADSMETVQLGDRYPSGVYNVVVTQGSVTETLRVVKR